MTKRRKLVLEAFILTIGFLATQLVDLSLRYWVILVLGVISYFFSALILKEDLKKIGWLLVLLPIVCYVVAFSLFYFLLPTNILIRILILVLFGIGAYAVLLTENIFSVVSGFQTIQLLRAAQAVGFLITLITAFFGYNTVFSYKSFTWWNGLFVFLISWPLIISSLWSISLEVVISAKLISYSFILSLIMGEIALFISFWPLTITTSSLFLISFLYVVLGIGQSYFAGRLFKNTLSEYLQVGVIIFIITLFLTHWRG